ncbi:Sec23/Sec24 zinc finger family protein [Histomonas meleagridis]|uniref:Sec23/Sec24 zinc finger family protein n=1 Tax=Histomonas meleagridis TaxID=135588 RepID=UPI00355AB929|nr:Sec23/Sec24 zinc finger family protein [Histomonas meleagridis]KAH0806041.1 Sec23/Sec24 zinc finger family protein [Histomonas meleagridis]
MVIIKDSDVPFSILCPYSTKYQNDDGILKYNSQENDENVQFQTLTAPIVQLQSLPTDFSKFIFSPSQIPMIINTLSHIQSARSRFNFNEILSICERLTQEFELSPIQFISIIPPITQKISKLTRIYTQMIRIDVLTPSLTKEGDNLSKQIPGLFQVFSHESLPQQLEILFQERTSYQVYTNVRCSRCKTTWKRTSTPCSLEERGVIFLPVLHKRSTPVILDVHTNGSSDKASIQIVSRIVTWSEADRKYIQILRVFDRQLELCSDLKETVSVLNPDALVWNWLMHSLSNLETNPRAVLAAVYRATSRVLSEIDDDENENSKKLTHACCSLMYLDSFGGDQNLMINSRNLMSISSPHEFHLVPKYDEANKCYLYGGQTYGTNGKIIPDFVRTPDPKNLDFLNTVRVK